MEEKEKQLLKEIDELHDKLASEPYGTIFPNGGVLPPSGYSYQNNAETLSKKVLKLYNDYHPEYINEHAIDSLIHTCDKEVNYVVSKSREANKSNAAQKRKTELTSEMNKATSQIELDVFSLFLKIRQLKENGEL